MFEADHIEPPWIAATMALRVIPRGIERPASQPLNVRSVQRRRRAASRWEMPRRLRQAAISRLAGLRRQIASLQNALDRLNALAREGGWLPTEQQREEYRQFKSERSIRLMKSWLEAVNSHLERAA
jgi:TolA-binding protein